MRRPNTQWSFDIVLPALIYSSRSAPSNDSQGRNREYRILKISRFWNSSNGRNPKETLKPRPRKTFTIVKRSILLEVFRQLLRSSTQATYIVCKSPSETVISSQQSTEIEKKLIAAGKRIVARSQFCHRKQSVGYSKNSTRFSRSSDLSSVRPILPRFGLALFDTAQTAFVKIAQRNSRLLRFDQTQKSDYHTELRDYCTRKIVSPQPMWCHHLW